MNNHGGARQGAGRKRLAPGVKKKKVMFTLSSVFLSLLDELRGQLSRSAFLERIIQEKFEK